MYDDVYSMALNALLNAMNGTSTAERCEKHDKSAATSCQSKGSDAVRPNHWIESAEDAVRIFVELPGCAQEDIEATVEKNIVYIDAVRKIGDAVTKFHTGFRIGITRDTDAIHCSMHNGLLVIKAPTKKVEPKPEARKIKID